MSRIIDGLYGEYFSHLDDPRDSMFHRKHRDDWYKWDDAGRAHSLRFLELTIRHHEGPAVVIYADGDGVKRLNDSVGHRWGNEVIRLYGRALDEAFASVVEDPSHYSLTRWGGDEFVCVVKGKRPETFLADFAQELHAQIGKLSGLIREAASLPKWPEDSLGMSFGWARAKDRSELGKAREQAEKAMYFVKRTPPDTRRRPRVRYVHFRKIEHLLNGAKFIKSPQNPMSTTPPTRPSRSSPESTGAQ